MDCLVIESLPLKKGPSCSIAPLTSHGCNSSSLAFRRCNCFFCFHNILCSLPFYLRLLTYYVCLLSFTQCVTTLSLGSLTHYLCLLSFTPYVTALSLASLTHYSTLTIIYTLSYNFLPGITYPIPILAIIHTLC